MNFFAAINVMVGVLYDAYCLILLKINIFFLGLPFGICAILDVDRRVFVRGSWIGIGKRKKKNFFFSFWVFSLLFMSTA